jgi:opacity protein-like surface antigen
MKKKTCVLGLAVLLAALMALAGVAQSAMWVGGQIGGNFVPQTSIDSVYDGEATFNSSVIGGAALGYDFVNAGFGAYAWPDWMKYFSVFTDFTYNRLDLRGATVPNAPPYAYGPGPGSTALAAGVFPGPATRLWNNRTPWLGPNTRIEGYVAAWSFLLMAHYPFLPDAEVPAGRLNPYVAVGPGIVFSGLDVGNGYGAASSVNIALVAEVGIRFMCLKNVSLDGAFRYRYCQPQYDLSLYGADHTLTINPLHQLSFLFRANYHF